MAAQQERGWGPEAGVPPGGLCPFKQPQPDSLMPRDEEDTARPEKAQPSPPAGKMSNPFLQLAQDPTVPTYKQGFLARKMHQDADGKKSECLPAVVHLSTSVCKAPCPGTRCPEPMCVWVCREMAWVEDGQPMVLPQ